MIFDPARVSRFIDENREGFSGDLRSEELLSRHTYYRIGGACRWLAIPRSETDIHWLSRLISETGISFSVIGGGSNLLASDSGFDGLVVKTTRLCGDCEIISCSEDLVSLRVGTSLSVPVFLRTVASQGIGGFAFLAGIPGSMGGVIAMNAGTHLGEVGTSVRSVRLVSLRTGAAREVAKDNLRFSYRQNHFIHSDEVVVSAVLEGTHSDPERAKAEIDEVLKRRKDTQPLEFPSCGSVFKNPRDSGLHAWQVIDRLRLRGHRIGNAQFSEKHCNFIVNLGGASAHDVNSLILLAKARAKTELHVELEEEVKRLGSFDPK